MAEGHRRRVMEKVFRYGIESLHPHEFLELYLFSVFKRKDTNPLAHALLKKFGSLENLCNAPEEEIMKVEGIGKAAAEHIRLLPLVSKGYSLHTSIRRKEIYSSKSDIEQRCVALLGGCVNEKVFILCFDNSRHLIKEEMIAEGDPESVRISTRNIINSIANTATTMVMLCHNHPSGVLLPSEADIKATSEIKRFLESINIELIDHIVVVDSKFVSCISIE